MRSRGAIAVFTAALLFVQLMSPLAEARAAAGSAPPARSPLALPLTPPWLLLAQAPFPDPNNPPPSPADSVRTPPTPSGPLPRAPILPESTTTQSLPDSVLRALTHPPLPARRDTAAAVAPTGPPSPAPYFTWTPRVSSLALPRNFLDDHLLAADNLSQSLQFMPLDARTLQVAVDGEHARVTTGLSAAEVPLGPERTESFQQYADRITAANLRRQWVNSSRLRINQQPLESSTTQRQGLSFALPVELPKVMRSFLGDSPPALNVSGSERISIAGRSNWSNQTSVFGRKPSIFPQLDMQQDLNVNIVGTLGDKVAVDVAQFSGVQTPLTNRIALKFKGEDDEIMSKFELGNTNLSLPGTQYVSYSGRNDGLFGVQAQGKLGATDVTMIASRQEARSERTQFQGSTQFRTVSMEDWQYIQRTYFLLQQPDSMVDANGDLRADAPLITDLASIQVYVDDRTDQNLVGERPGVAEVADPRPGVPPDSARIAGNFDRKEWSKDYVIRRDLFGERFPVLVMQSAIPEGAVLAVTYSDSRGAVGNAAGDTLRLKLIKAPYQLLASDPNDPGRYSEDPAVSPLAPTREYELRNFYSLGATDLDPKTAKIQVRKIWGGASRDYLEQFADPVSGENITYLEATGLDLLNQSQGGQAQPGQDGLIDQFADYSLVDWTAGVLYFPDLRPFAPRDRPGDKYFAKTRITVQPLKPRRRTLTLDKTAVPEIQGNDAPYEARTLQQQKEAAGRFYIFAELSSLSGSSTIYLRNVPVVEGSEIVTVNGETLIRETDYRINYQTGSVDLLSPKARKAGSQLSIDYSYAPLFAQASKTLVGSAMQLLNTDPVKLGGAFLYEARGLQEKRPRAGEEPTRTMIGDLNTTVSLQPHLMTALVDALPFYRAGNVDSKLDLSAETGYSIPNPNTKNELYLDDFEGARNSNSASMNAVSWQWASPPPIKVSGVEDSVSRVRSNAVLHWFNPYNVVHQRDLRPNLTKAEDSQAAVSVLSWWIPRKWKDAPHDSLWAGLTQALDPDGVDLSRSQFIDIWLNDFRDFALVRHPGVKLHIDLGVVSEDEQRRPDELPNGKLDSEDLPPRDRQLVPEEDTGLDGVFSANEPDVVDSSAAINATLSDPHGDDWQPPEQGVAKEDQYGEGDPRHWRYANGTEHNQPYKGIPDTEDLNGDGQFDTAERFFRYTIDLGDTNYLDTDVYEKYSGDTSIPSENRPTADNGWRRFLVPLDDLRREVFGGADLYTVKHMRVWIDGIEGSKLPELTWDHGVAMRPLLELAQIEIVGNRWVADAIDSVAAAPPYGEDLVVRTVNNREDAAVYDPPFKVGTQTETGSSVQEREQSLALRAVNLVPGGQVSAYRPTTMAEDYSRYHSIRFYAAALDFAPADSLRFFLRFSSDGGNEQRNYYEYSAPLPPRVPLGVKPIPWQQYDLSLTDFSSLKIGLPEDSVMNQIERPGKLGGIERLRVIGRPSFTRIQRVVIGLENARGVPVGGSLDSAYVAGRAEPGELWVDELRAFNVDRDRGSAQRVNLVTNFSDLMALNLSVDRQDENFQRLGQLRGSGNNFLSWRLNGSVGLDKFLRGSGFNLPINFGLAQSRSVPRFFTGQDIRLRPQDGNDQRTTLWSRQMSLSISHAGSRNWFLKNTLDGMSGSFSMSDDRHVSPTSVDTSRTLVGGAQYTLIPREWLSIPMPLIKTRGKAARFYFLPQTLSLRFDMSTSRVVQYDRLDDGSQVSRLGTVYSKNMTYDLAGAWRPIGAVGYSFSSHRNANLPGILPLRIGGLNFGRQVSFQHRFDTRVPVRLGRWITPEFSGGTSFNEARGPDLSPELVLGNFSNSSNGDMAWTLPLTQLGRAPKAGKGGSVLGRLLSRLGDVRAHANFNRSTSYTRLSGYPSIGYRLGFDRDPGFVGANGGAPSVLRDTQTSDNVQRNKLGELSTTVALWNRGNARVRAGYTENLRSGYGQSYVSKNKEWPDINADWGTVQKFLGLGKVFPSLSAQTHFSYKVNDEGPYGQHITARTTATNWQPLISLTGTTTSGVQTLVAAEYLSSLRQDYRNARVGAGGTSEPAQTSSSNLTVRAEASKTLNPGSKFNFFGLFGSSLRSTLTLAFRSSYNRRTGGTKVPGQDRLGGEIHNDRIDMSLSGTYSFSRNVNGTLGLGFNQYRDFTHAVFNSGQNGGGSLAQRSLRVEANAQMSF